MANQDAPGAGAGDESGVVVALAFSSMAFAASTLTLWRMRAPAAEAEAKRPAARSPLFNACAGVAAVSGAATAFAALAVSRAASLRPYDPYAELGLPFGASEKDVTQAYRRLSKTAHPDRGGDKAAFHALERAHRALTDPAAMSNMEKFGNPEGTFGRRDVNVDAAKNPFVLLAIVVLLLVIVWAVVRTYVAAKAAEASTLEEAGGAGAAPSSAKDLKIAKQKAMQEQDARRREREAKKHGSASPPPAVEKMD